MLSRDMRLRVHYKYRQQLVNIKDKKMLPFRHPFTAICSGPSQCGKTQFILRVIHNASQIIEPAPERILYCYDEYQSIFTTLGKEVEFHEGLPNTSEQFNGKTRTLLILDDLVAEADITVANLFTKISHHRNVSVFFLTQNIFHSNKQMRTISLNAHYLILFKSVRDVNQIAVLARQMFAKHWKFAVEAFQDATAIPHSYLLIDLKSDTNEKHRLRTNIFPTEQTFVYVNKKSTYSN